MLKKKDSTEQLILGSTKEMLIWSGEVELVELKKGGNC